MKLMSNRFKTDKRKYFFIQQVIQLWNSLPVDVIVMKIDGFKSGLDRLQRIGPSMVPVHSDEGEPLNTREGLGLWPVGSLGQLG